MHPRHILFRSEFKENGPPRFLRRAGDCHPGSETTGRPPSLSQLQKLLYAGSVDGSVLKFAGGVSLTLGETGVTPIALQPLPA